MNHNFWPQNNEPFNAPFQYWYHCKCCPCLEGEFPLLKDVECPGDPWCKTVNDADFFLAALNGIRISWSENKYSDTYNEVVGPNGSKHDYMGRYRNP